MHYVELGRGNNSFCTRMNIWDAYSKPKYYNVYFNLLIEKGIPRNTVETLRYQYGVYLTRIKGTIYATRLKACATKDEFQNTLEQMFESWEGHIQYKDIPSHYMAYLAFLDSLQAIENDFISQEEKQRIINPNLTLPISELTVYETEYMKDGKLVALMNPQLLYRLRIHIDQGYNTSLMPLECEDFYGNLLPAMSSADYSNLIDKIWDGRRRKCGIKKRTCSVILPEDQTKEFSSLLDALQFVIDFYGPAEVQRKNLKVQGYNVVVTRVDYGQEKNYIDIGGGFYMCKQGRTEDRQKILNTINAMFGRKLTIVVN